jgi:hypothetical protein
MLCMDNYLAALEWERRQEYKSQKSARVHEDLFRYTGIARAYFLSNERRILKSLGGKDEGWDCNQGEWYARWEDWAMEQWERVQ